MYKALKQAVGEAQDTDYDADDTSHPEVAGCWWWGGEDWVGGEFRWHFAGDVEVEDAEEDEDVVVAMIASVAC